MNLRRWTALLSLLALLVSGCLTAEPPPPTTTLAPPTPTLAPTPTATPVPTASPSPTPTASPSPTPTPTPTASPSVVSAEVAAKLQAALEDLQVENSVPGMEAAVILPHGARWAGVSGVSSAAASTPATTDTVFVAGSITKTFVAATIMQLADEGVLTIDDPLSRWLPTFPNAANITLRQLLSHTSGVFNYFEHPRYNRAVFGDPTRAWTPDEILDQFVLDPYCDPGTCYHYSNTGFILLGLVIEDATGHSLGEELRTRWIVPLGLADTYWQADTPLPPTAANGHLIRRDDRLIELDDGSDYRPTRSAATVSWAAGAIASTATDLATWCQALYGDSAVSAEALVEMTNFAANPYSDEAYGLGTRTRFLGGRRMVGHTGSLRGFYAAMWHFPVENVTVVVMLNLGRIDPNPMADRLAGIALTAAGLPSPTASPPATPVVPSQPPVASPLPTATPSGSPSP